MSYHELSWVNMNYHELTWIIMNYHELSWIIMHINIRSLSTVSTVGPHRRGWRWPFQRLRFRLCGIRGKPRGRGDAWVCGVTTRYNHKIKTYDGRWDQYIYICICICICICVTIYSWYKIAGYWYCCNHIILSYIIYIRWLSQDYL